MPFSDAQITHAIEQGLRRTAPSDTLSVVQITCEDVDWRGLKRQHICALWCQHHCRRQRAMGCVDHQALGAWRSNRHRYGDRSAAA